MSGRRPPGVGKTLSSLFRNAIDQLGSVREVVDRGTQLQKNWFDTTLLHRKRKDALALLGEAVYRAAVAGQLERVGDEPQFRRLVEDIDELDQRIEIAEQRAQPAARSAGPPRPQRKAAAPTPGAREPRVWRPVAPWTAPDANDEAPTPAPARPRHAQRAGEVKVAADPLDPSSYPDDYDALDGDAPPDPPSGVVRAAPRQPSVPSLETLATLGNEIGHEIGNEIGHEIDGDDAVSAFSARAARHLSRAHDDGDDDLEQYMHEDDVPELAAETRDASAPPAESPTAPKEAPKPRRSRAAAAKKARQSSRSDS